MIAAAPRIAQPHRWLWWLVYGLLALYVAARMGAFTLSTDVATPDGVVRLPNTFASVDHPFHVARAETLWRELGEGNLLRWIGQHQGGYPVEFYPLGEPWLEVTLRVLSLGSLHAEAAHTLAVIALFLLPGVAFAALAREDGWSPAVGFLALVLHVSLPGGWYDGGYTELVQWGLITNVAGAVASFLMLPPLLRFLATGAGWGGAAAAALAALAVYCNPRSLLGLAALVAGAVIAGFLKPGDPSPTVLIARAAAVSLTAGLLAAPELSALARFRDLYAFVRYSGYGELGDYLTTSVRAVGWPVLVLALVGAVIALITRRRLAALSVATTLILYALAIVAVAFVPAIASQAEQLEPTRLMPLQRLLTLYLAAVAIWVIAAWLWDRLAPRRRWLPVATTIAVAATILLVQTRPLPGPPPDPASPAIPAVSLYPVAMSAEPSQADLEAAVRAADASALPGTAILVLGSQLSWHQQLWVPLWTARPLYYDNWLWYWRSDHAGTPGYAFRAGHHYPDPERTLDPAYLSRHGIGAVVVSGALRQLAASSPLLMPLAEGVYDAYLVRDPVTTVTFGEENAAASQIGNQRVVATSEGPAAPVVARVNWHPRWEGSANGSHVAIQRRADGYQELAATTPLHQVELLYAVQAGDWVARGLALAGIAGLGALASRSGSERRERRWYARTFVGTRPADDQAERQTE